VAKIVLGTVGVLIALSIVGAIIGGEDDASTTSPTTDAEAPATTGGDQLTTTGAATTADVSENAGRISKGEMGDEWPLTVPEGFR